MLETFAGYVKTKLRSYILFRKCINERDVDELTPLHLAIGQKRIARVLKLLEFEAGIYRHTYIVIVCFHNLLQC